jgi:glutamine synthetase
VAAFHHSGGQVGRGYTFEDGLGFDGSSIRGWQAINESDMLVVPQPETAWIDPFTELTTLAMICNIQDPITREDYSRDPRNVARKAVNYLKSTGIADTAYIGPEAEFFVFDDIRFDQKSHQGFYYIDSIEGEWNRGRDEKPNLGYKLRHKEGYFPVPPADQLMNIRNEMMQTMIDCGLDVEASITKWRRPDSRKSTSASRSWCIWPTNC